MTQIDPNKSYSMYMIVKLGVLGASLPTVKMKIMKDQLEGNILKTRVETIGKMRRYHILGANLIKYLKAQEV
jgi:hypothetical protein